MQTSSIFRVITVNMVLLLSAQAQDTELPLKAGDRFALSIGGIPQDEVAQISKIYTVSDGGTINLVHIGEVRAVGLKPSVFQRTIEQAYIKREIFSQPTVVVTIDGADAPMRMVYVVSGCKQNGPVPYNSGMTIMKAVSVAKGFSDFAKPSQTKIIRGGVTTEINLKDISSNPSRDMKLQPEDQIIVPE